MASKTPSPASSSAAKKNSSSGLATLKVADSTGPTRRALGTISSSGSNARSGPSSNQSTKGLAPVATAKTSAADKENTALSFAKASILVASDDSAANLTGTPTTKFVKRVLLAVANTN
jgi:hypothetical protein